MSSKIASILINKLNLNPTEASLVRNEFARLAQATERTGAPLSLRSVGVRGEIQEIRTGNVQTNFADGITLIRPSTGKKTVNLQPDGDAFFGSDLSLPGDTSLGVFANPQAYNGEDMGEGDVLLGDNSNGKANLLWDRSEGKLKFRGGKTTHVSIGTDGKITADLAEIGGWEVNSTQIKKTGIILDSSLDQILVGSGTPRIVIDGGNKLIKSSNYTSGVKGFLLDGANDYAEFGNIRARGEFHAALLALGEKHAVAGSLIIGKSAGKLKNDVTSVASPTTFNVDIEDPATGHIQVFDVGDYLLAQDGSGNVNYWIISSVTDQTTFFRYVCTLGNGTAATFQAGTAVTDLGQSGDGYLYMSADDSEGPFYSVRVWTTNPWTDANVTEYARIGNLKGSYSIGVDRYGVGVGDFNSGNYFGYNIGGAPDSVIVSAGDGAILFTDLGVELSSDAGIFFWGEDDGIVSAILSIQTSEDSTSRTASILVDGSDQDKRDSTLYIWSTAYATTEEALIELKSSDGTNQAIIQISSANGTTVEGDVTLNDSLTVTGDVFTAGWTDYSDDSTITGWSSFTVKQIFYKKVGRMVFVSFRLEGTSNSTSTSFTLPFTSGGGVIHTTPIGYRDNGAPYNIGYASKPAGNATINLFTSAFGAWTASGTKTARGQIWYEADS